MKSDPYICIRCAKTPLECRLANVHTRCEGMRWDWHKITWLVVAVAAGLACWALAVVVVVEITYR